MNRLLGVIAFLIVLGWIATLFRDEGAVSLADSKPWPNGLGTFDEVRARFPAREGNDAAARFLELAKKLPKDDAVDTLVLREIRSGALAIGAPPALPDLSAIRALLLEEVVEWERFTAFDAGEVIARRPVQMAIARFLVAGALAKARANDSDAWNDLRAAWILARSQDGHPQMMARTAALSIARMVNAVAWKMPLPAPSWLAEVHARDPLPSLLEAFQFQTASYSKSGSELFPTRSLASSIDRDRSIAETLAAANGCEIEVPMNDLGTDLISVWKRTFRFRAEREGSANALRVREGRPVVESSAHGGNTWTFDGKTLRYSRELPTTDDDLAIPMHFSMDPR